MVTENDMVRWPYQIYGHEFEQTLGDSEGQGSLACCSPRVCKEPLDVTEQLNKHTPPSTVLTTVQHITNHQ